MQNVPWYMDLVGAGFTNHGSNAGGILIDTESGGHVELVNADPGSPATAAMPDRFFTVDELYNTNRNPVAAGIAHPLVYENEDTLVGQLGYGTGSLMNSDKHAMVLVPQLRRRPLVHDDAQPQLAVQRPSLVPAAHAGRGRMDRGCRRTSTA